MTLQKYFAEIILNVTKLRIHKFDGVFYYYLYKSLSRVDLFVDSYKSKWLVKYMPSSYDKMYKLFPFTIVYINLLPN